MAKLCSKCVKALPLKKLIQQKGKTISKCEICGGTNTKAVDCELNELKQLFKALIRQNYSEWEYNTHWGGSHVESLFYQKNNILNFTKETDELALEEAILTLIENVYEGYEDGVSLYSGYDKEGNQNLLLKSLRTDFDTRLNSLNAALKDKNYFLLEKQGIDLLTPHIAKLNRVQKKRIEFYRARIGYEKEGTPIWGWGEERHYIPYTNKSIGAPPPLDTKSGRMNREGVSFLYLASNSDTAIAEVRPHPSQIVSLGKFENKSSIKIADFTSIDICDFYNNDKLLDEYLLLKSIENLFCLPVTPDQKHKYSITQFFSDILRHLNFDGVAYRSSISSGENLTIFDPECFEYVKDSGVAIKIETLSYATKELELISNEETYTVFKDGKPVY